MSTKSAFDEIPLGLFEVASDGKVLYYKSEPSEGSGDGSSDIVGRNLTDVMRATNVKEFQTQLDGFRWSSEPARSFNFVFAFEHVALPARVLLARTREQTGEGDRESVFVHIRKA